MPTDDPLKRAAAAHAGGDAATAEAILRGVLAETHDHPAALSLLGHVLVQTGRRAEALPLWVTVAAAFPTVPAHRYNLAELRRQLGHLYEAEAEFRAALALAPDWPDAHFGLANTLKSLGHIPDALAAYDRAIALRPDFARALYNRGNVLREEGRVAAAERDYRRALAADPDFTDCHINLGAALGELHRWSDAEVCYRRALALRPDDPDLPASLAGAVLAQGRTGEAAALFAAGAEKTADPVARFRRDMLLPHVATCTEAAANDRRRIVAELTAASHSPPRLAPERLHYPGLEPPMGLAYQPGDLRPILELFAALYVPQVTPLSLLPPAGGKPRVGVVVTHGHEGVYDRCLGRLVERIASAGGVAVTLVSSPAGVNILRHLRPTFSGEYLPLPPRVDESAARVRDARFDLMHYWEVGTDATNYFLPFFRPAPVQCATWGWPVTTGNPRVDWYVSAAPIEPPNGPDHYTEKLARLPSLPTCYERPPAPPPRNTAARRKTYRLDGATPVYLCVQNVRKLHPDFDAVLAALLAADPRGRVVILGDEQPAITAALLDRLRRSLGSTVGRVGVVPRQDRANYLRLVAAADVLLDTPHYGAGANTLADAVACGTPVVAFRGRFHRGRWGAAVLDAAGLSGLGCDTTADYVAAAFRVASDEAERRACVARLREFGAGWFDNPRPAAELEAFWLERIAERE